MPFLALLEADLINRLKSWTVRIWLILTLLFALGALPNALQGQFAASDHIANLLSTYPLIWSTFVIVISAGAISGETGLVADSILSKAVTRYAYVLAKLASRLITVMGVYLLVMLPFALLVLRYNPDDLGKTGVFWALLLTAMPLALLTSLCVALSALFNRTLVVVVLVWFLWYATSAIFGLMGLEHLSPIHLIASLPATLRGDYALSSHLQTLVGFGLPATAVMLLAIWHFSRKDL